MTNSEKRAREHFLRQRVRALEDEIARLSAELRAILMGEDGPKHDA
jgi:hypothetical protein